MNQFGRGREAQRELAARRRLANLDTATTVRPGRLVLVTTPDRVQKPIGIALSDRGIEELLTLLRDEHPGCTFQMLELPMILV